MLKSSTLSNNQRSINYDEAIKLKGVIGWVDYRDVPHNSMGSVVHDEKLFADSIVTSQGQPVGLMVAENQMKARQASKLVKVEYDMLPSVITIEEAIKSNSFFEPTRVLHKGNDVSLELEKCAHVINGVVRMGGQEHFYLETNAAIVVPHKEENEIEIFASTQNPTELQVIQ